MPETSLTLFVAALLFALALFAWLGGRWASRRIGAFGQQLRAMNEQLISETKLIGGRMGAQRSDLADLSAATERTLWSLSRFDERLGAVRAGLAEQRIALDQNRSRLIAAHATILRLKRAALMLMKTLELRRAILG